MKFMTKLIIPTFAFLFLGNCNIFNSIERGVSPFAKFLSVLNVDRIPSTVTSVLPKDKSTGNFINTNVFVVFSKPVSGFNKDNFTLSSDGGATNHVGTVTANSNVVGFYPSVNFNSNATYKVTLKASGGIGADYTFTFSTGSTADNTAPTISSTNPAIGDTGMPINISITATLSEAVDPTTVSSSTMTVTGGVSGTVTLNDQTITFKPTANLPVNTTLAVSIRSGIKDLAGNTMTSAYSWTFTTGSSVASSCTYDVSVFDSCLYE